MEPSEGEQSTFLATGREAGKKKSTKKSWVPFFTTTKNWTSGRKEKALPTHTHKLFHIHIYKYTPIHRQRKASYI